MENTAQNIKPVPRKSPRRFSQTFNRIFFIEKLYNTTGFILLATLAIIIAAGTAYAGI